MKSIKYDLPFLALRDDVVFPGRNYLICLVEKNLLML